MLWTGEGKRYGWTRYWISPGDPSGVAVRGLFSADMHALTLGDTYPPARTLEDLQDVRVLLLRGESGSGKTGALILETERLRAAGETVEVVDLADEPADLLQILDHHGGLAHLTIIVDGLDEELARDPELAKKLRQTVEGLARAPGAKLRFALRATYSIDRLIETLAESFEDDFEHLTIAPLRADDVHIAAVVEGVPSVTFFDALEILRVVPLAARPPTLLMLIRLWQRSGSLPTRREYMYELGCNDLLREASITRRDASGGHDPKYIGQLDLSRRFAIASGLAAHITFGDYKEIDIGTRPTREGLHAEDLAGAKSLVDDSYTMSERAIREVVGTALFRPTGPGAFAFAHPSLQAFLAANYVMSRSITPVNGASLLLAPDGRVGANRVEVASWLGALDQAYFNYLVAQDPQVLLRSGIPAAERRHRLELAKSLLNLSGTANLDIDELVKTGDLVLVSASGLETILAQILSDKSEPLPRRDLAMRMARDTGNVPLDVCVSIALDENEPIELREYALAALPRNTVAAESAVLMLSAAGAQNSRLHVTALAIACRDLLKPADVIRRLKISGEDKAQRDLCARLFRHVAPADLPEALDAVVSIATQWFPRNGIPDLLYVAQSLADQAFDNLDNQEVLDALARFICKMPACDPWLRWSYLTHKRGMSPRANVEARRQLVAAVLEGDPQSLNATRNILEASFLLRNEDLPWIIEEALESFGQPTERSWSTIVLEVATSSGGPPYGHLRRERVSFADIDRIAGLAQSLPSDYQRWEPPESWYGGDDPVLEYVKAQDIAVEPIEHALDDWLLQNIQAKAGGRASAPSVATTTLTALVQQADRRFVADSKDLLRVVTESLVRLQGRIKGRNALVQALWNERRDGWQPKVEEFLSDFVADHLRTDLGQSGVVADREVQIRPRVEGTQGQRTDIQVQVFAKQNTGSRKREVASLTIEVKGCYNKGLFAAMEDQLVKRYLTTTGDSVGLYLVAWYICPSWTQPRIAGLKPTSSDGFEVVRDRMDKQASSLSTEGRHVIAYVLDASLN